MEQLGDLESTIDDPLVQKVRWIVQDIAKKLNLLTPSVRRVLESSKTIDPGVGIANELNGLTTSARSKGDDKALAILRGLGRDLDKCSGDSDYKAELQWVRDRLQGQCSRDLSGSSGS